MSEWFHDPCGGNIRDPEFLKHVRREYPDELIPDERDFERSTDTPTDVEASDQYRAAQLHKLKRMYRSWKAGQN
jgi:hypothetical protein